MLPERTDPADVVVVMEPTRNAWVPLAAWFRRHGAEVVLVPPERSADLRWYYSKHSKTDRLDSQLLARLPMLHPDGLHAEQGLGPGDALKRAAKLHSTLTHRRTQSLARLDALREILGPAWHAAIGADLANRTPLKFLAAGYADPYVVKGWVGPVWPGSATGTHAAPGASYTPTPCSQPPTRPWSCGPAASWNTPTWPKTSRSRPDWRCS
jgi:Transposase